MKRRLVQTRLSPRDSTIELHPFELRSPSLPSPYGGIMSATTTLIEKEAHTNGRPHTG